MGQTSPPAAIDTTPATTAVATISLLAESPPSLPTRGHTRMAEGETLERGRFPHGRPKPTRGFSASNAPLSGTGSAQSVAIGGESGIIRSTVRKPEDQSSRVYNRARSQSNLVREPTRSTTPGPQHRKSRSASRTPMASRKDTGSRPRDQSAEIVPIFFNNMARSPPPASSPPTDSIRELVQENTSLQQRIAAISRNERDLLAENQKLSHQLAASKQHFEARRKWHNEFLEREKALQARIKELENRAAQQEEELQQYASPLLNTSSLTDEEITKWLVIRSAAWQSWVEEFAHLDPQRIQVGLHPSQLRELCGATSSFVRLEEGGLPRELFEGTGVEATHILLYGMLSNFVITETLQSPFWVFTALSDNNLELESPSVIRADSRSPIGFRMDLAMWSDVAAPRSAHFLPPLSARLMAGPPTRQFPPTAGTTAPSLTLNTASVPAPSTSAIPGKDSMEGLYQFLSNVQRHGSEAQAWRSHLFHTLSSGGLSRDLDSLQGDERRRLADARKIYARKLKDRFLSGAARFLLQDQSSAGIEALETRLVDEIDLALRFSCQMWSRPETLRFQSLLDLGHVSFSTSSRVMELYPSHHPSLNHQRRGTDGKRLSQDYDGVDVIIMVTRPAIEAVSRGVDGKEDTVRTLSKAQVLVASSKARAAKRKEKSPSPPPRSKAPAETVRMSGKTPTPVPLKNSALLLPSVAYKPVPSSTVNSLPAPSRSPNPPSKASTYVTRADSY